MAVFFDAVGAGDVFNRRWLSLPGGLDLRWKHSASGSQIGVVVAVSYWVNGVPLDNLTRRCWYGGTEMTSLGVKEWGGSSPHGWTELFGLVDAPRGSQTVHVSVFGGVLAKLARGNSVSYTGVDSFGTVTDASGNSTGPLAVSATGDTASKLVAVYGTATAGLNAVNRTRRYVSNTAMSMLIADADGTGSSLSFSATRITAGPWSALAVVVNAADIVATATGIVSEPDVQSAANRYPRPGTNRRVVFAVGPEN